MTGASRREAAERFEISASSAVKWLQRWDIAAKPTGGSTSPLEKRANFLLGLIAEQPDLTLDEVVAAMRRRRIRGSRSAVWRLFDRHGIGFKKKPAGSGARAFVRLDSNNRLCASVPAADARYLVFEAPAVSVSVRARRRSPLHAPPSRILELP